MDSSADHSDSELGDSRPKDAAAGEATKATEARSDTKADASETAKPAPGSALVRFVPAAERFDPRENAKEQSKGDPERPKRGLFFYASRAAVVLLLVGGFYAAARQFFHAADSPLNSAPAPTHLAQAPVQAPVAAPPSDAADLRRATQQMSEEIRSLKASLETLRSSIAQSQSSEEIRGLKKSIDSVKSETNAALAQLSARLDYLQRDQAAKLPQGIEKPERVDQNASNAPPPGAVPPAPPMISANAAPQAKPPSQASLPPGPTSAVDPQKKASQTIPNWVVRDVYDGIALVEGPGGAFEVMAGENIPGVGTVKSIERRGKGWIVVTNRGLVEYAHE